MRPDWSIRRAESSDVQCILDFCSQQENQNGGQELFGRVHVASLLETSYLAMTAIDQDNEPIAFIAFDNSPPRSCEMEAEKFHRFLQTCFYLESADFTIQNTLWLSYFTCKDELNLQMLCYVQQQDTAPSMTFGQTLVGG